MLGMPRLRERIVGRIAHLMERNGGRFAPYQERRPTSRLSKARIPTTKSRNSQRATYIRQGQTQQRNILTQPLQPESVAMRAPENRPSPFAAPEKSILPRMAAEEQRTRHRTITTREGSRRRTLSQAGHLPNLIRARRNLYISRTCVVSRVMYVHAVARGQVLSVLPVGRMMGFVNEIRQWIDETQSSH